ncbi:MAG TPA: citrate synthase/methylcitrate synthase [Bacillota bacterium]
METMTVHRGLKGIAVAETTLSFIDGTRGLLLYRGLPAEQLALERGFEEVAHLLWYGRLPAPAEAEALRRRLVTGRGLPGPVQRVLDALPPDVDTMSVVRTAVSAMAGPGFAFPPTPEQAAALTAVVPTIIAYRHRRLSGQDPVEPRADLGHVANYLYMLSGREAPAARVEILEAYMVLTMEHGMNASTFAARVTTSTRSDLVSALVAAVGTMKGPLHGGAPSEVDAMLDAIGEAGRAEDYLRDLLERGERIMGFGHRVYRTRDPRAAALAQLVRRVAAGEPWLELATHVETTALRLLEDYKPGRRLSTNVEFWAAAVLRAVGIPPELYTPTFTAARVAGWCAHALEQAADNQLIRPEAVYVGPRPA